MEKTSPLSNRRSFTKNPHVIYLVIIVGLIALGIFKKNDLDQQIKNEEQIKKELRQRVGILLSEIESNNKEDEIIQEKIDHRGIQIDSLKRILKKMRRSNYRTIPYNERNRAIELAASEE